MKTIALPSALGVLLALSLHAVPAQAEELLTFVATTGFNGAPCTQTAPCKTFGEAHANTTNGGRIACLDSGYFGSAIIAKSITIDCMGHNASTNAVSISGNAIVVVLRGLNIYGFFTQNLDTGVSFGNGQELHIEHSTITGFTNGNIGGTAAGIRMSAGGGRLFVSDTVISVNGTASGGGGIIIEPFGSGNRRVVLNRVQVTNNSVGISSVGAAGSTLIEVRDSTITGNQILGAGSHGIVSQSSSGLSAFVIERSSINLNSGNGIMAQGPATLVHIGRSTLRGNLNGGLIAGGGASILSYGDNHTKGNAVDGAPTGVLAPN